MTDFQEGEQVKFNIGKQEVLGTVTEVVTKNTDMGNYTAHGSKSDPRLIIEQATTGNEFVRRPDNVQEVSQPEFQEGEQVKFSIGNQEVSGTVKEMITEDRNMGTYTVHATEQDPKVIIDYDKTGTEFVRRADIVYPDA